MGHHHLHTYLAQTLSFGAAALVPGIVLMLLVAARWESHRRKHGHPSKAGSRRSVVTARFAADLD